MKSKCLLVTAKNTVVPGNIEIPMPKADEVLIRTAFSCISPGTELRCLAGGEEGSTEYPYVPGYAIAGEVVEAGSNSPIRVGNKVFCSGTQRLDEATKLWGGHTAFAVIKAADVVPVPDGVDLQTASLAALGAIAYHGCRIAKPQAGETVAVVGLGPLGQLSARIYKAMGLKVVACDLAEARVEIAINGGIDAVQVSGKLKESMAQILPDGADIVVDVTGAQSVIPQAIELTRELPWNDEEIPGSRYVIQGSYADTFQIPYNPAFFNELSFLLPRNCQKQDKAGFLALVAAGMDVSGIIGRTITPADAQATFDELRNSQKLLTAAFTWLEN